MAFHFDVDNSCAKLLCMYFIVKYIFEMSVCVMVLFAQVYIPTLVKYIEAEWCIYASPT